MKLSEFKNHLLQSPGHQLRFILPDGGNIEAHAHITEVGRIEKSFIDCGGTIRRASYCSLQAWVADDTEHRLAPRQLATIIQKATPILGSEDLDVEVEYEDGLISQFPVVSAEARDGALHFLLAAKHTDCLAKELCLPVPESASSCCSDGGCC